MRIAHLISVEDRASLGRAARERIVEEYSVAQLVSKTQVALERLL